MKISINCPSYKRPIVETLKYLPYCKVWVSEDELEEYKSKNKNAEFRILSKQGNVSIVRNEILDKEFNDGADVVCIVDDDLKGIYHYEKSENNNFGYEKHLVSADEFEEFIIKHTNMCKEFGFYLWGLNVNNDPRSYRHFAPINTTSIILGPFSCHLKGSEIRYDERIPLKEDYDLAIQHLNEYRGILRLNKFHYDCKQSIQAGGCATIRNYKREEEQLKLLQNKWGSDIVRLDKTSKKKFDYNPIIKIPIKGI